MGWVRHLCRFCGQIGDVCYNIFDPNLGLEEKVKRCLNIEISQEDFKPKEICSPCYRQINEFSQFVDLCISTSLKFESIYYSNPYSLTLSGKHFYGTSMPLMPVDTYKQSVIVSSRGIDQSLQYPGPNKDGRISVLENCSMSQSDLMGINSNYNIQPSEATDFFNSNEELPTKSDNAIKIISNVSVKNAENRHDKSTEQCLVLSENIPNYILDELENEVTNTIIECTQSDSVNHIPDLDLQNDVDSNNSKRKQLISVDKVKESLGSQHLPNRGQNSAPKKEKSYPCPHCDRVFKRKTSLTAHISVHTNIRQFKCLNCPKTFSVKCHLTQHNKTHLELYKCHICQKTFPVPSKLSRHMRTHDTHAHKPYRCDFGDCNKAFSDKHNLNQHILCHATVKSLSCNICEKLFKTRKILNAHIKGHVTDRVFQCLHCSKNFRYKHNLKSHLLKHEHDTV